ncbi:shootin-1-like isoform X2 [Arapaima gigas]
MWTSGSGDESSSSSEDQRDYECDLLEKERDEANWKLSEMELVSQQLLKEIDALEIQFQVERSCRENAEAIAIKVTKENKALKRRSQALMPLISELPENLEALNVDSDPDLESDPDTVGSVDPVLQGQAQIRDLQESLDKLLGEKMQLSEQVEALKREQAELKEEVKPPCPCRTGLRLSCPRVRLCAFNSCFISTVSQLVSKEFDNMSQQLELEQGLRQHAEVFAHQMLAKQKEIQRQSVMVTQNTEMGPQIQQALSQVAQISTILEQVQLQYLNKVCSYHLILFACVRCLLERLKQQENVQSDAAKDQEEPPGLQAPPPPPPPPPPPLPLSTPAVNPTKSIHDCCPAAGPSAALEMKARAVDEMMERIRKGIVLRPTQRPQQRAVTLTSQVERNEKRKSAVQELQGILNSMSKRSCWRGASRKRISRNVGEAELQAVLQRRRKVIGDEQDHGSPSTAHVNSGNGCVPWASEGGSAPVLRRLKQNRESRNSRVRASEFIILEER